MSSYRKTMRQVREEMLVISEAKYELYHKDFSGAMQHAYKMAKKLHGITIDPKEIDDKVATGPRKPSEGDTNKYRLKGDKGGIQVQVYNKGGSKPFELNFYKEEADLDEVSPNKPKSDVIVMKKGQVEKSVVGASAVKKAEKEGFKIQYALLKTGKKVTDPKGIMKAIKSADKLGIGEEVELDEAKMSSSQIAKLKKAYEPMRGKKISTDNANKLSAMMDKVGKDKEALIQLFKADIPFVSQSAVTKLISKHNMKGAEINKLKEEFNIESVDLDEYGGNFGGGPMRVEKGKKKKEGVDEGTKQILAHGGKGKYKVTKDGDKIEIKFGGKVVGTADFDRGADSFFVSIKGEKGQKSFDDAQAIADYFAKNKITEEVELDEKKQKPYVSSDSDGKHVMNASGKIVKSFRKDELDLATAYLKKNYDALMKEEVDLDEAEDFKPHKMYDPETGKAYDVKTMDDHLKYKKMGYSNEKPEVEESAASDARRAIALDPSTKQKFSKNVSATDDDVKSADKNIMMQMRKAVSLRGNKVEFMDKKKVQIPQKVAQAVLDKYNSQKKPADKEKFQTKVSKSYKDMLSALKEQNEINNKTNSLHELKSLVREMKGKNNG